MVDHPLVRHHLTKLRSAETSPAEFRQLIHRLAVLLAFDATQELTLRDKEVQTPICETVGTELDQRIGLVPILRAGLGMVDPILNLIPDAEVWHLGLYRDEETAQPVEYYNKLPEGRADEVALILDPMLATGGSAASAYHSLKKWGVKNIRLLSVIAAPEGIQLLQTECPELKVHVCSVDQKLNEKKFIVPGLGDAGDRIFNT